MAVVGPIVGFWHFDGFLSPLSTYPHCNQPCYIQVLRGVPWVGVLVSRRRKMRVNAKPATAPGDGAPGSEYPALIKMSYQQSPVTKLDQAVPVRAHSTMCSPHTPLVAAPRAENGARSLT